MNKDRRNFITKSSLTLLGLGISNTLLGQIHSLVNNETTETIAQKLKKAANRRRNGQLNQAKNIYNNIIAIDSNEIRAYDGLRKILLQSKYKELEVLQLYNNGLNQNPTSLIFKERVAKEYMRLSLGNKKFTNQLNIGQDLLLSAKQLFNQVRTEFPNNQQFETQFQKAKKKINQNATTIDARINTELKVERKNNRENFKIRFKNLNNTQLEAKLNFLLAKPNSIHRIKHIKEVSIIYINKLRKNGNINLAIQKSKIDLQNTIATVKSQVEAEKRNKEILKGLLQFVSAPLYVLLNGIDLINYSFLKHSQLLLSYIFLTINQIMLNLTKTSF